MSDFVQQQKSSYLSGGNQEYLELLYEDYLLKKSNVPNDFLAMFNSWGEEQSIDLHSIVKQTFKGLDSQALHNSVLVDDISNSVVKLIHAYRAYGHQYADLDPLQMNQRNFLAYLELSYYKLDNKQQMIVDVSNVLNMPKQTIQGIFELLQNIYANNIGMEYLHINNNLETEWLSKQLESIANKNFVSKQQKKFILSNLIAAEGLEKYLGTKYVGQKRFSLEGADALIPGLNHLINVAATHDVEELVIGMAHRGRLNVLINVLGKSPAVLFEEFAGKQDDGFSGDVKYHMGFSADRLTNNDKSIHVGLAFNPSHLEIISPVVSGSVRSRQIRRSDLNTHNKVIPIVIHGDAAFAGQGVVMETMNFSQSRGYGVGGTIHIIINNQIGFTTSNPLDARATLYASDIAKTIQSPIIHVNADCPEKVVAVMELAFLYRMKFKKDVVVDLVCYRRHGHNEADAPAITQPLMYQIIKNKPTVLTQYTQQLIDENIITIDEYEQLQTDYRSLLDQGKSTVANVMVENSSVDHKKLDWTPYIIKYSRDNINTNISNADFVHLANKINILPADFTPHPVVAKLYEHRNKMASGEVALDWGFAEMMAYASILYEGYGCRLSGQDSGRGTFAHRHAVLHDNKTGAEYHPLNNISEKTITIDSVLSEEAVLAFEYGVAISDPKKLVIWEAQFGDFANGAQVVIDQFIASGEQKWGRMCGLTMFLPHGFEGQGPEHSSGRMERFLQLCAQDNIQVCVPTLPAQIFHLLRRQVLGKYRKPLIVFTPKSLLRHKQATSRIDDLLTGEFQVVIDDHVVLNAKKLIFCQGKIYYELLQQRQTHDIALVRIEEIYPFPVDVVSKVLAKHSNAKIYWCQEEPENQGAWPFIQMIFYKMLPDSKIDYIGREALAAPAEGSAAIHAAKQQEIIKTALTIDKE